MNIIKTLIVTLFLVTGFAELYAQDDKASQELDTIAIKIFESVNNKDFDTLLDMTYPKLFEIVPKESMLPIIKSMFEGNDEFAIEIPNEIPNYKLSDVYKDEETKADYAFLSYDLKMKMTFNNKTFSDEQKETMKKMMKIQGMDVEFLSTNTLNVLMKDRLIIFIKDNSTNKSWKTLNYDPDSPIFFQILSVEILENAKAYNQNLMLESKKQTKTN